MRYWFSRAIWCLIFVSTGVNSSPLSLERVASGLEFPLFLTAAPGVYNKLYVLEKNSGAVKVIDAHQKAVQGEPYFVAQEISSNGEGGLLGLAFHPDFETNRELYVSVTNTDGASELRRYIASENPDNLGSDDYAIILTVPQFATNHNGGWVGFGPDGYLYYALGDGGGGNDPQNNGQDLTSLLGSVLRLDVSQDDFPNDELRNYAIPASNPFVVGGEGGEAQGEIWAYGLRNPWRLSFDRSTGDLWIADVGQNAREEVNFQANSSAGGENYGWRLREGFIPSHGVGGDRPSDNVDPLYDYPHGSGDFEGFSVTGGYVYRGPIKQIRGHYFFADFAISRIWSMRRQGDGVSGLTHWTPLLQPDQGMVNNVSSFGEDLRGNLYVIDYDGEVFKFVGEDAGSTHIVPPLLLLLEDDK